MAICTTRLFRFTASSALYYTDPKNGRCNTKLLAKGDAALSCWIPLAVVHLALSHHAPQKRIAVSPLAGFGRTASPTCTKPIDTTTPMGKFFYQVRNSFAELERNYIRERTIAGMEAAKKRGVKIGRPRKLTVGQISRAQKRLTNDPETKPWQLAEELGVAPDTLLRSIKRHRLEGQISSN